MYIYISLSLFFSAPLFVSPSSSYASLLYVQGLPLIFFNSSSHVRLPSADQTRWLGSSLLSSLHPFRPEDRRHSFDPSWYNESVLPVRRSSTEDVKVKCDSDSSWCHDAGVQQNWLFLSCRAPSRDVLTTYACPPPNITVLVKTEMYVHVICNQIHHLSEMTASIIE